MSFIPHFFRRIFMITRSKATRYSVIDDASTNTFNVDFGKGVGVVAYKLKQNKTIYDLYDSKVPVELRGQGYGKILAKIVFNHIAAKDKKMILTCTFLRKVYEENKSTYKNFVIEN